jgi:SAM-dependent methyltransferase
MNREQLATKYMHGCGLEIGAGHNPFPNPNNSDVVYVDRCTREDLLSYFPKETQNLIPETDIVADGFNLNPNNYHCISYVVSSHVLEHTPRPAAALDNWLSVIDSGGYIIGAVPNKDHTFDRDRTITTWEDLTMGNLQQFRLKQFTEWYSVIDKISGPALDQAVKAAEASDAHIHFPVWDYNAFDEFIKTYAKTRNVELIELAPAGFEMFFVLRKK